MATEKEQLRAMADELAEKDGMAVVADDATAAQLRQAIDEHKSQLPASSDVEEGATKTYKVVGAYRIFGLKRGQTFEAATKENDDTGEEILVMGSEWALKKPLLEAGWIEEA